MKTKKSIFANVVLTVVFIVVFLFFFRWGMKIDAISVANFGAHDFFEMCQMLFAYTFSSALGGFLAMSAVYLIFFSKESDKKGTKV